MSRSISNNVKLPLGSNNVPPVDHQVGRSRRLAVFLLAFIICLYIVLLYNFQS